MGTLPLLLLSLFFTVSFAICGKLNPNITTSTTTKATPLPTSQPTVTAGSFKTPEPTVTSGTTTLKTKTSTGFPSSTTPSPLLIISNKTSLPPLLVEEETDFADDLVQAQAPIEQKLPTSHCKAAAFSHLFAAASPAIISTSSSYANGILSETSPSSLPRREKIFVRVPTEECPVEIMLKTITGLNNLRNCQGLPEMTHNQALAAEAKKWASETATKGVVYKPNYGAAGQYATSTAAPYAVFSLDLTGWDVMAKWKGSGNNYLPWYTGAGDTPRHFSNDEWRRVREFGVGCAAYRYKTAKAMFWTVVFFRKA